MSELSKAQLEESGITLSVAKSVRIPRADEPDKVAFELTCEEGLVSIRRVSTAGKVSVTLVALETALGMLK